jgi:hypothetical protein
MKKRAIALLLCLATLFTVCLSSCGGNKDEDTNTMEAVSSREPLTLSMWVVTGDNTTEEAMEAVEAAFNSYTKSNFTTAVDLVFVTEDEYKTALANYHKEIANWYQSKPAQTSTEAETTDINAVTTEEEETTAETVVNQYGVPEIKYPDPEEYQLDIVLMLGEDMYYEYANSGLLMSMSTSLLDVSKKLSYYIYPTFFDAAKLSKGTFAVPNNHAIGEYTYLLVNRALAAKYYIDTEEITSVNDCLAFLSDIKANESVAPVKAPYDCPNIKYWSADGSFSVLASDYSGNLQPKNIFAIESYVDYLETTAMFKQRGYYASNPDTDEFGIAVIKGTPADIEKYAGDYDVIVLGNPIAESSDLLSASFAVSAYTSAEKFTRAMEIIVALNTVTELRDILQWGVEDVTYTVDDDGQIEELLGNYDMNMLYTGNAFVASNPPAVTDAEITAQKQQNLDSVNSPFNAVYASGKIDEELYVALADLSSEVKIGIDSASSVSAMRDVVSSMKNKVDASDAFKAATDLENKNSISSVCADKVKTDK